MRRPFALSCHCRSIRLEVNADLEGLRECNCSTCRRSGFIHWYVPTDTVKLETQRTTLSTYVWREAHEGQHFCPTCGTVIFRTGYPGDRVSVNARCLEGVDVFDLKVERFDGRNKMPPGPTR